MGFPDLLLSLDSLQAGAPLPAVVVAGKRKATRFAIYCISPIQYFGVFLREVFELNNFFCSKEQRTKFLSSRPERRRTVSKSSTSSTADKGGKKGAARAPTTLRKKEAPKEQEKVRFYNHDKK